MTTNRLQDMSDEALVAETKRVAEVERRSMAELLELLIEVERRNLCQSLGCSSLFKYCTTVLGLSEQAAYSRINAARAAGRFPAVLPMLADGALTLSSIGLLAPHLTEDNHDALLDAALRKSTREVQKLVACANPQPDIPASVRALPATATGSATSTTQAARHVVAPLAPRRYLLKVTIGEETHVKLERARALLRHVIPDGDPAALLDRALTLLIDDAERTKCAATSRPRVARSSRSIATRTRHIPAMVKRAVWQRDQGRCAFVGSLGRCEETAFLEFHHVEPFAAGGASEVDNLQLRCRAHNQYEARLYFGDEISARGDLPREDDLNSARA
jgi:5-methylcytosine-specific restriction endonuclease McrA